MFATILGFFGVHQRETQIAAYPVHYAPAINPQLEAVDAAIARVLTSYSLSNSENEALKLILENREMTAEQKKQSIHDLLGFLIF